MMLNPIPSTEKILADVALKCVDWCVLRSGLGVTLPLEKEHSVQLASPGWQSVGESREECRLHAEKTRWSRTIGRPAAVAETAAITMVAKPDRKTTPKSQSDIFEQV